MQSQQHAPFHYPDLEEDSGAVPGGRSAGIHEQAVLQIRNEIGVESIPTQAAAEDFASQELSNLYVTNKLVEIIISFLHAKHLTASAPRENADPSEIFLYLYTHLNQKITLAALSKIFYMSESAISAYITNTAGLSFFDLLNEMRIGKTINYLLYTDFTLEELAEILGFVDSAHISKVFWPEWE